MPAMADADPSTFRRFEHRAGDYAASRPDYPARLVDFLLQRLGLPAGTAVADIGSGTGIFSHLLLGRGLRVTAIEPNDEMRSTAEMKLGGHLNFTSGNGTAQATRLATGSAAAIFCAQAFHWFNEAATLREWQRILKPGGTAVLIWNYFDESSAFFPDYSGVIRAFGAEAEKTISSAWNAHLDNVLFRKGAAETVWFSHDQRLDFAGLLRRVASTSYLPNRSESSWAPMAVSLREVFDRHQSSGVVTVAYRTVAVFGPLV